MSILPNRRLVRAIFFSIILIPIVSFSQVTIKEKVEIKPKPQPKVQTRLDDLAYFEGDAHIDTHQSFSVLRSCKVTGTGTLVGPGTQMMIVWGIYGDLTNRSDSSKFYCVGAVNFELWTWTTCAIVVQEVSGSISGSSAKYKIKGYQSFPLPLNLPFEANVEFTAGPCPDYDLAGLTLDLSSGGEIYCGGSLPIGLGAFDAGGRTFCDQSNTQVTATVSASGNYVYLASKDQSGSSITFPLSEGSFSVVLDPALGMIPNGFDVAHVSVQSGSAHGTADVTLSCVYEPPTVQILNPAPGSPPVYVSERRQPVIWLAEYHTPVYGALEPKITWTPKSPIDTKDYFSQLQESIPFPVPITVTATNIVGTATDNGQLVLMKVKDPDHYVVTVTPDTIVYDDYAYISALAVDKDGNEVLMDENTPMTVTADPSNIGYLWWDNPVPYGVLKSGNLLYRAAGDEPTTLQNVMFTVSDGEKSGMARLVVKPKPCLVLQLSKTTVGTRGTVAVTIVQRQFDGTLTPFPGDQMFFVWMNTDESYGTLRSGWGDEGSWLFGPQPFTFIAADSISMDSVLVQIEVEASSGGVGLASEKEGGDKILRQQKLAYSKLLKILSEGKTSAVLAQPKGKLALKQKAVTSVQPLNRSALLKKLHQVRKVVAEDPGCVSTGTVIVTKGKEGTFDHFTVTVVPDSIIHGQSSALSILAVDANGKEVQIDGGTPITFTASPSQYGGLEPAAGITYSMAKSGGVMYDASGTELTGNQTEMAIQITASGLGKSGVGQDVIERVTCARVVVHPDVLAPGETATLEFENPDGTAFLAGQKFNVDISSNDGDPGQLVSSSGSGRALANARAPITFVAPSGITGNSLNISFRASAIGGGGTTTSVSLIPIKKVPVQASAQALIKSAQDSVVAAIKKLLDESSCPLPGEAVVIDIEKFCQGGGTWGGLPYDKSVNKKKTKAAGHTVYNIIADNGCALSCAAMVAKAGGANVDPGTLNSQEEFYGDNGRVQWGFINGWNGNSRYRSSAGYIGAGLKFKTVDKNQVVDKDNSIPIELGIMDSYLEKGALIVAQVFNPTTGNPHFVLVVSKTNGEYKILDPACYSNPARTMLDGPYECKVYKIMIFNKQS